MLTMGYSQHSLHVCVLCIWQETYLKNRDIRYGIILFRFIDEYMDFLMFLMSLRLIDDHIIIIKLIICNLIITFETCMFRK